MDTVTFVTCYFLDYIVLFVDDRVDEECEEFSKSKSLAWDCCLAFAGFFANFNLALLIKVFPIKKRVFRKVARYNYFIGKSLLKSYVA